MTPTLTPPEADRHLDAARFRWENARDNRNSWARVIADMAINGAHPTEGTADELRIARAAELEARADWDDARRLRAKVRNGAMFEGRWVA